MHTLASHQPVGVERKTFRFTLATIGTRGDLNPLLAIADELLRRGHTVHFATPHRYQRLVEQRGMRYFPLRPDAENQDVWEGLPPEDVKRNSEMLLRKVIFPRVEETYHDLVDATQDTDLLAAHHILLPASMAAERRNIPWSPLYFSPSALNSLHDPPVIPMLPWLHPAQCCSHHVSGALNGLFKAATDFWYQPYHALRAREGFPPERRNYILDGVRSPHLNLALFSDCIAPRQADWPENLTAAGFPFIEEPCGPGHDDLLRFMEAGPPPIVATLGTAKSRDMQAFFAASLQAAQRLDQRIVLLTGADAANRPVDLDTSKAFAACYAPYAEVFRRAAVIIHSGAIGALAEALRSGKPMLVVPAIGADQPDNAFRAARLGVAKTLPMDAYNAFTAAAALHELLTKQSFTVAAQQAGDRVRNEHGAECAADLLESAAGLSYASNVVQLRSTPHFK